MKQKFLEIPLKEPREKDPKPWQGSQGAGCRAELRKGGRALARVPLKKGSLGSLKGSLRVPLKGSIRVPLKGSLRVPLKGSLRRDL